MVSADNLNHDVLEQILGFLSDNDLPSTALVSQSFLAAALPRLYKSISYRLRHSKGYNVVSLYFFLLYLIQIDLFYEERNNVSFRYCLNAPSPCCSYPEYRYVVFSEIVSDRLDLDHPRYPCRSLHKTTYTTPSVHTGMSRSIETMQKPGDFHMHRTKCIGYATSTPPREATVEGHSHAC